VRTTPITVKQSRSTEIYTKNKFHRAKSKYQKKKPSTSPNIHESKAIENPKTTKITSEIALVKPLPLPLKPPLLSTSESKIQKEMRERGERRKNIFKHCPSLLAK
jgi:hypothetical protein